LHIARQDIIVQVCMLPARVTCNGCVIVTCGDVVNIYNWHPDRAERSQGLRALQATGPPISKSETGPVVAVGSR
jgi:hypothetical protein